MALGAVAVTDIAEGPGLSSKPSLYVATKCLYTGQPIKGAVRSAGVGIGQHFSVTAAVLGLKLRSGVNGRWLRLLKTSALPSGLASVPTPLSAHTRLGWG